MALIRYLPGVKLPANVLAVSDLKEAAKDCSIFVFVVPHQFVDSCCKQLQDAIPANSIGISLIKGVETGKFGMQGMCQN